MKLKPYFRTPKEDFEDTQIAYKRGQSLWDEIQENFPQAEGEFLLNVDTGFGKSLIRAFIYCPENVSDVSTRLLTRWMKRYFGNVERNFREKEGRFYWVSKVEKRTDENGDYEIMILLENTHPLTCEIVKVKKEVEVYESICK